MWRYAQLISITLTASLMVMIGTAVAGPLEDATTARENGDYATALKLLRPLADQGIAGAEFNLGLMYAAGHGVPQDYVSAHMWLNLAAAQFLDQEKENRESALKARDLAASKLTPAQIAQAQKLAHEWKPKSAEWRAPIGAH